MPATDIVSSTIRRDQVQKMNGGDSSSQELELETFQKQVSEKFNELSSVGQDELLSLKWIRNLLDVFICCQENFRIILFNNKGYLSKQPMERIINEYYERSVKALDVCNAVRDGIEQVREWEKLLEIVFWSLENRVCLGEGTVRRAKKGVVELLIGMLDEKETNGVLAACRNRSFGRGGSGGGSGSGSGSGKDRKELGHFRSLSWGVSRGWSASRQIQAIGYNLSAPRGNDVMATNGLAVAVYTMSCVLFVVMWVLVAAIPCQDRGLQVHFSVPRQFVWGPGLSLVYERIVEESKKKERKNACGLLKEIYLTEKWTRQMNELLDSLQFPLSEEKEVEIRERVEELKEVFESLKEGLYPLERQVREVFHRVVRSRTEGLDSLGRGGCSQ